MSSNYKDTLNLPKTEFPMKADLVKREPETLARWESGRLYEQIQEARRDAPLYVMHDGPPFANGDVHMGTALNKILKDIIVKSRTMSGFRAPFVPGWDCHGLPIEYRVVKEAGKLPPIEVRRKSEEYARRYIDIQRVQFKRLGVLADWDRPYLTLDPAYEADMLRAFATFVERDLVYESKKPVFWSTGAQTALAEAEVEYQDRTDPAVYVKFPIVSGQLAGKASVAIWTTTPWTLPANLAIAVHPKHRYVVRKFHDSSTGTVECLLLAEARVAPFEAATGWRVTDEPPLQAGAGAEFDGIETQHPFLDRRARLILADFVTLESGTGNVHIAPGHGADDYAAGMQYKLPILSPVDDHGRFTEECGVAELVGKYVFDANPFVVNLVREKGGLLGEQPYTHSYPYCWRSKTPVVFRAVDQFFIRIDALRAKALAAVDKVTWFPHWGRNRIYSTIESRPDWVISRQRSWGVPLPVFYTPEGKPILDADWIRKFADLVQTRGTNVWFEMDDAEMALTLGLPEGTKRRGDTLDVWIDSGLSHQAVLRRNPALREPADVYIEATDQHRGWFNSSLTTAVALGGDAPYKTCVTHGFVVDLDGKKISKSGAYQKPMDAGHFVGKHGADIVRLWVSSVNFTDDVPFSEEMFTRLSDTYRRIRNTLRILLGNLHGFVPARDTVSRGSLTLIDRWILSRLQEVISVCREGYEKFEFHKVYHALNQFCAVDLSSLYVDITKDRMYCDGVRSARRRSAQTAMYQVFDSLVRLMAPILAFTSEEAWHSFGEEGSIHLTRLPDYDEALRDPAINERFDALLKLRAVVGQAVERARQEKIIGNALEAAVRLEIQDATLLEFIQSRLGEVEEFFILSEVTVAPGAEDRALLSSSHHRKCERCWRHRPFVGRDQRFPDLCERCVDVVSKARASIGSVANG